DDAGDPFAVAECGEDDVGGDEDGRVVREHERPTDPAELVGEIHNYPKEGGARTWRVTWLKPERIYGLRHVSAYETALPEHRSDQSLANIGTIRSATTGDLPQRGANVEQIDERRDRADEVDQPDRVPHDHVGGEEDPGDEQPGLLGQLVGGREGVRAVADRVDDRPRLHAEERERGDEGDAALNREDLHPASLGAGGRSSASVERSRDPSLSRRPSRRRRRLPWR